MKTASHDPRRWRRPRLRRSLLTTALGCLLAGCGTLPQPSSYFPEAYYHPTNFYRRSAVMSPRIKRVAVLPLAASGAGQLLESGSETLSPILEAELVKAKRFEVIPVSAEQSRQWTGQSTWRTDEALPTDFFDRLRRNTGCDAVLFCQLIRYQPYQPMAIGWKFSLVENPAAPVAASPESGPGQDSGPLIMWSADELFDASTPEVAKAARWYYLQSSRSESPAADASTILASPSRFGQFSLVTLLATLPTR